MPTGELLAAFISSSIISPAMAVIDMSVIKTQMNKSGGFKDSCIWTLQHQATRGKFWRPYLIMNSVYTATYGTANLTELYCKKKDIDFKIPTLLATSVVNILMIGYKDREFSKIVRNSLEGGSVVRAKFPIQSQILYCLRDSLTIFSNFVAKKNAINFTDKYMSHNTSDLLMSILMPVSAQFISTPLHILGVDYFQHRDKRFLDRIRTIPKMYSSICLGRIIRVIPAFGLGGFINDMIRQKY